MNRVAILAMGVLIGGTAFGIPFTTITSPVDPRSSFLTADLSTPVGNSMLPDAPVAPAIIDVTQFQGQTINILPIGGLCFVGTSLTPSGSNVCNRPGGGSPIPESILLGGIFSTDSTLGALGVANRVPNGINTGLSSFSTIMFFAGTDNTNPNDFVITNGTGLNIVVPGTAHFLFVGVFDSFYKDNTDPSNTLSVQVSGPLAAVTSPEPATYAMLLTGFGGLLAFRRLRSRRG